MAAMGDTRVSTYGLAGNFRPKDMQRPFSLAGRAILVKQVNWSLLDLLPG
jgi:hypothetical protein